MHTNNLTNNVYEMKQKKKINSLAILKLKNFESATNNGGERVIIEQKKKKNLGLFVSNVFECGGVIVVDARLPFHCLPVIVCRFYELATVSL